MEPAVLTVLTLGLISAVLLVLITRIGTREEAHDSEAEARALQYWQGRAEKLEGKRSGTVAAVTAVASGGTGGEDAAAEKERKRAEALARKAARANKSGDEA
jgi:hypothetical protein